MNAFYKPIERIPQRAEFVIGLNAQAAGQITFALGYVLHGAGHYMQRLHQQAYQHTKQGNDRNHGNGSRNDR